ncbi:unnamed protein product [Colias eurytheme]|nr:unnamed protein product [Colias eurytheme]
MTNKCKSCGKFYASADGVKCNKCNVTYHHLCHKLSPDARTNKHWICKSCKPKLCRPVDCERSRDDGDDDFQDTEQRESLSLVQEIKLLRTELSSFRQEMTRLSALVNEFGSRLDGIEERVTQLEEFPASIQTQQKHNEALICTVEELKRQLNDSEQEKLLNDVEISGISESSGENVMHIVVALAQKVGVTISANDIVVAERRGARRAAEEGSVARARPIVVRLTRRSMRDELLHAARVRRGADTAGTGIGGPTKRFYINERLTHRVLLYI